MNEQERTLEERIAELQAERAVQGLSPAGAAELERLLREAGREDDDWFDLAAAAAELGILAGAVENPGEGRQTGVSPEGNPGLPAELAERVLAAAGPHLAVNRAVRRMGTGSLESRSMPLINDSGVSLEGRDAHAAERKHEGWTLNEQLSLLAAGVLVAFVVGWALQPAPVPALAEARTSLVRTARDVVVIPWKTTDDPAASGVSGDVVWSGAQQRGFLRFRGLKINDPKQEQYQLWIFDAERDEQYPVDGGLFNITHEDSGEAIVPIQPRVKVSAATLFAVTVEQPGGVVVSTRERLPLLAPVPPRG